MTATARRAVAPLLVLLLVASCSAPGGSADPAAAPTTTGPPTTTTAPPAPPSLGERTLVGAYYYLWNPENLAQGWLRNRLRPAQRDMQTQTEAPDRGAADDIRQAAAAGIDFFAVNWWPSRPEQNARLDRDLLAAPNIGDIRFCLFYEMQDLGFDARDGTTTITPAARRRFVGDLTDLAHRYFGHPRYLQVGGRPVVVLYLTRTLVGDVAGAITEARAALRAEGYDVLLIGDEIFWTVARNGARRGPTVTAPQPSRAELFDALTAYNLYEPSRRDQAGYGASSSFLADSRRLFDVYRYATGGRVPLLPSVIPGFNDRGVRASLRHPVIPRRWAPYAADGSFLAHALDDFAIPLIDPRLPMVFVSTWNEWNEDTAIEPVAAADPTTVDDSPSGRRFTDGYAYPGTGTSAVDVLRDRFGAPRG